MSKISRMVPQLFVRGHAAVNSTGKLASQLRQRGYWPLPAELTAEQVLKHFRSISVVGNNLWLELDKTPDSAYTNSTTIYYRLNLGTESDTSIHKTATTLAVALLLE